ncbi:MAG: hypothetical protein ACT4ON_08840 [Bacteroidota bacterium]
MLTKKNILPFLFVMVLVAGDFIIGKTLSVLAKKQKCDKRIEMLLQNKIDAEIIILGSSRANNDYSPEIIMAHTGQSCYNLGISGTNTLFHETVLDLILLNPKRPKLIIYNIDDYGSLYNTKEAIYRLDELYPYVDHSFVNDRICTQLKKNKIAVALSNTYRENVNFSNSIKYLLFGQEKADYRMNNINKYGATLIVNKPNDPVPVFVKKKLNVSTLKINEEYKQSLISIQNKCKANGIKLMLCFPPKYTDPTFGFYEQITACVSENVTIMDFSKKLKDANHYFDAEHLNKNGAAYFSQLLSEEIKKIME